MDTQQIELLGRNLLISELIRAGVEVALPLRDRGVDLLAYDDRPTAAHAFAAIPIQMKASSRRAFALDRKYEKVANLLLVHVWNVGSATDLTFFALRYPEAVSVAEAMGWTKTSSWASGGYSTPNPSKRLLEQLKPFAMSAESWLPALRGTSSVTI